MATESRARSLSPWAFGIVAAGSICLGAPQQPLTAERSVINQYCVGCHNAKLKTAGLALDTISAENVDQHPEIWEKVVRKLDGRYMPPIGLPRPNEAGYNALVSKLERALDSAAEAKPNPGRSDTFRRLNRTEYQNAIRDLLGLEYDVAPLLPSDESSHGFDNVTVGNLSPVLLERYLSAARKISRLAIGTPSKRPATISWDSSRRTLRKKRASKNFPSALAGEPWFITPFPSMPNMKYKCVCRETEMNT